MGVTVASWFWMVGEDVQASKYVILAQEEGIRRSQEATAT